MGSRGTGGRLEQSAIGVQEFLKIDFAPAADAGKINQFFKDAGSLNVTGNYEVHIDVSSLASVDIIFRASAVTGSVTPAIFLCYADGSTSKTAAAPVALVAATRQTITMSGLKGEKKIIVRIPIVNATAFCTFDQFEWNGL